MKFVSLISSGIDSPVATYLISKKADELILVHADNRPLTDDKEIENFIKIANYIKKLVSCPIRVYLIPNGKNLIEFKEKCNNRLTCVFCKRMILRYAEKILEKENAGSIVMGDSLGQVASQTLQNIRTIEQAIKALVLRPLIGLDKEDIVKIAKEIGTYDISILPSNGCSAVPKKPSTRAKIDDILAEEEKIDVQKMVKKSLTNSTFLID